jgi:hypothetical protein
MNGRIQVKLEKDWFMNNCSTIYMFMRTFLHQGKIKEKEIEK